MNNLTDGFVYPTNYILYSCLNQNFYIYCETRLNKYLFIFFIDVITLKRKYEVILFYFIDEAYRVLYKLVIKYQRKSLNDGILISNYT